MQESGNLVPHMQPPHAGVASFPLFDMLLYCTFDKLKTFQFININEVIIFTSNSSCFCTAVHYCELYLSHNYSCEQNHNLIKFLSACESRNDQFHRFFYSCSNIRFYPLHGTRNYDLFNNKAAGYISTHLYSYSYSYFKTNVAKPPSWITAILDGCSYIAIH